MRNSRWSTYHLARVSGFGEAIGVCTLRRSPGFAACAILALALGIGANVAVFSVVDAMLVRPLQFRDAGRLVNVWEDGSSFGFPHNTPAPANFVDWKQRN